MLDVRQMTKDSRNNSKEILPRNLHCSTSKLNTEQRYGVEADWLIPYHSFENSLKTWSTTDQINHILSNLSKTATMNWGQNKMAVVERWPFWGGRGVI